MAGCPRVFVLLIALLYIGAGLFFAVVVVVSAFVCALVPMCLLYLSNCCIMIHVCDCARMTDDLHHLALTAATTSTATATASPTTGTQQGTTNTSSSNNTATALLLARLEQ